MRMSQGPVFAQADGISCTLDQLQRISGTAAAGRQHAVVPTGDTLVGNKLGQAVNAIAGVDLPARRPRLVELDARRTERVDIADADLFRSEERRVGKEGVSTCRSRWSPYH